ncbi:MAG: type II secretion system protein [Clostridium sp.]
MLKKDRKKGVTLIELIIALSVFILLAIPVTNGIISSIKINKTASENKERSQAMSYAYENLKKIAGDGHLLIDKGEQKLDETKFFYNGKSEKYIFTYNAVTQSKLESIESVDKPTNIEFQSNMVKLSITLKSSEGAIKSETYNFKVD